MYCSQCGKSVEENEKFCRYCGKEINCKHATKVYSKKHKWILRTIICLVIVFAIMYVVVKKTYKDTEADISIGGNYYGSYEWCNNRMPLGIDDNVWGMSKDEFEKYTGIALEENKESDKEVYERYELPTQFGGGYKTGWGSYVVFYDGYGLSMIVLDASSISADELQPDLTGEMLNWLDDYGTYIAKKNNNRFILYELNRSYALLQNWCLEKYESANLMTNICYVSKEAYKDGKNFVLDINDLLEKAASQNDEGKGIPLIEMFDEDLLVLAIHAEDIKENSINVITVKGKEQTEYAVQIELEQEIADILGAITYSYMGNNLKIQTLRTELEEITIVSTIKDGKICIAYYKDEKTAEAYAEWIENMME